MISGHLDFACPETFIKQISFSPCPYPKITFHQEGSKFTAGYQDYLDCEQRLLDFDGSCLKLRADSHGEMPIFYHFCPQGFFFADDFLELAKLLPSSCIQVDNEEIKKFYSLEFDPFENTFLKDVFLLGENLELTVDISGISIKKLRELPDFFPIDQNPPELDQLLTETCTQIITFAKKNSLQIGATLSGGLDSAIIAHKFISLAGPINLYTLLLPDPDRDNQKRRVEAFAQKFGGRNFFIDTNNFGVVAGTNPYLDTYWYPTSELARTAAGNGDHLITTGFGGDELFNVSGHDRISTGNFEQPKTDDWLYFSNLPPSIRQALLVYAPSLRKHSLWPIAPLAQDKIINLSFNTPLSLLRHKSLLKAYIEKHQFPSEFLNNYRKESFKNLFLKNWGFTPEAPESIYSKTLINSFLLWLHEQKKDLIV